MSATDKSDHERRDTHDTAVDASRPGANGWLTAHTAPAGYRTIITARGFQFVADEPTTAGGTDGGPTPYEYLLAALGSCTAMTLRMYAARKGWPLDDVVVRLRDTRSHATDCANCETESVGIQRIERQVELHGRLTDEQRRRLLDVADRCPIKQTLERGLAIAPATRAG